MKPTPEDGRRRRDRLAKVRTRFLEDPDGFVDGEVRLKLDTLHRRGAIPGPEAEARLAGILTRFNRDPMAIPAPRAPVGQEQIKRVRRQRLAGFEQSPEQIRV